MGKGAARRVLRGTWGCEDLLLVRRVAAVMMMGDIGEEITEIELEPLPPEVPAEAPMAAPVEPAPEPVPG